MGDVDALAQQASRLTDEFRVNYRQKQRVVADVVLDHQDYGNIHRFGVVVNVALVLDVLHHRDKDASVTLPEEDALDVGLRMARNEIRDLAVVVRQHHYRHPQTGVLDLARQFRGIHVHDVQVADDEVETRFLERHLQRLFPTRNVGDTGNLVLLQLQRFADEQLVQASVLAQDERVVEAGNQQDVVHPERHQVLESVEETLGGWRRIGGWPGGGQFGLALRNDSTRPGSQFRGHSSPFRLPAIGRSPVWGL